MAIEVPWLPLSEGAPLSEEEIRSMVDEGIVDPEVESSLRTVQSDVRRGLELHVKEFPSLAHLDWVDSREGYGVRVRDRMVEDAEYLRHGAAVFEDGRNIPCEEDALLVSELRSQAAWCDARRAEADALVADARRLRDRYLREMAATKDPQEEAGLVTAAASDFLAFLAKELDGGVAPEADAARAQAMDAAARAGHGVGARFAATFVGLAGRVRRLAEAYAAGGEDEDAAVVEGLRRRADEVEALCADPEALLEQIFDSGWYTFWKYMNEYAGGRTPAQSCAPAAPKPTPTPTHPL